MTQPGGSCDTSQDFPVTVSGTNGTYQITTTVPNEFVRLKLAMTFEGAGPWRDTARVEIDGTPYETTTVVKSYSAGGGGTGTESPTPTPTPTETPTETPTPTPTPTETDPQLLPRRPGGNQGRDAGCRQSGQGQGLTPLQRP